MSSSTLCSVSRDTITKAKKETIQPRYDSENPKGFFSIGPQIIAAEPPRIILKKAPDAVVLFQNNKPNIGKKRPAAQRYRQIRQYLK